MNMHNMHCISIVSNRKINVLKSGSDEHCTYQNFKKNIYIIKVYILNK